MNKVFFLLITLLLLSGCSNQSPELSTETTEGTDVSEDNLQVILDTYSLSSDFVIDFTQENREALLNDYTYSAQMQSAMTQDLLNQVYEDIANKFGSFENYDPTYVESNQGGYQIITYILKYSVESLNLNIVFDDMGAIAGFNYTINQDKPVTESDLYTTEDVTFGLEEYKLSGTLTIPKGIENPPLLILVHGSGPNDRNESVGANTPFADIAHALGENGIATLRYDKRTYTYGSKIDPSTFTFSEETLDDAIFAFDKVKSMGFDKVFILGHSLGGHAIPIIAEGLDADGYIIAAGYVSPLQDIIVSQYTYLLASDGEMNDEDQATLEAIESQAQAVSNIDWDHPNGQNILLGASEVYWKSLNQYDVLDLASHISAPVFILNGERDYQVTTDEFNLWKNALESYDNFTFKLYPSVNHLLFKGEGAPNNAEYNVRNDVDSEIISDLVDFIQSN